MRLFCRLDRGATVRYNVIMTRRILSLRSGQNIWRSAVLLGAWVALLLIVSCTHSTPTPSFMILPTSAHGAVRICSTPPGALIYVDDTIRGEAPQVVTLEAGRHRLHLEKPGFSPSTRDILVEADQELLVVEGLQDSAPPEIQLAPVPASAGPEDGLKISATATDNFGVVRLALFLDGQLVAEAREPFLRYNLDTRALQPGRHQLVLEAQDAVGNLSREQGVFTLLVPTAQASATVTLPPTPTPSFTPTSLPSPSVTTTPKPAATEVSQKPVSVSWGEITIQTYAYEQALYTDPGRAGHPYPLLDRGRIGPPRPRVYKVLRVRNEYLELTLMPELGGRIYQCRFLPTGQELFYNNRVIKPSHWGPPEQGWWLAVGGMEFCLPVEEHGYLTAEPWIPEITRHPDGSATVSMSIEEHSRRIKARVDVTLRPNEGGFHLRSTLSNPDAEAKSLQYWINAMLSPGAHGVRPSLRFYYPTSRVIVHSRGDNALPDARSFMPWPTYDGRDLSHYANWRDWLGFFAPELSQPFTAVYDEESQLGIVRVFPLDVARGVKLFAFGLDFRDAQAYTDDGTQYVEMWGGWTPTFWDYGTLPPQASLSWEESWYVLSRCGGPVLATEDASLSIARATESMDVIIASPGEHRWTLRLTQGSQQIAQQDFAVRPDKPFRMRVALKSGNSAGQVTISVMDSTGRLILSYTV